MNKNNIQMRTVLGLAAALIFNASLPSNAQSGQKVYSTYCSGCHGAKLEGSIATALIKKEWKHGGDKQSLVKTISKGIPSTEMIGWESVLSKEQIDEIASVIVSAQTSPDLIKNLDLPLSVKTRNYNLKIEKLVTGGITGPWGLEFVGTNRALITGKTGELRWMVNGKLDDRPISGLPQTYADDNYGGMMDLALEPEHRKTGWVYLAYSHNAQNSKDKMAPGMTKIVRGKVVDHKWVDQQVLFEVQDSLYVKGGSRWGCRFLIDKQGFLYFTIGDMGRADDSQDLSKPTGKIYRINRDGSIPRDNPFYGKPGVIQAIYSWGNRNAQGIAQHPTTGVIYVSEHGPQGGDELNILKNGANYGWPVITYGIDYDGSVITNLTHKDGMEQPITYWTPSIAVGAIEFVTGNRFNRWKNNLIVTALKFQEVRRLVIDGDKVKEQEILLKGYGRVRDVKFGPDGAMYVVTNGP
ncbi:PQQ-dependent sugar dehydrogenase, partial [Nostocales cyanobacterium LEGE 12452]|nr:PQQ-dependent sugar dehydrogenase [Nostocales cyanobacterium LEGE 12452]